LPEIIGDSGILIDPTSIEEITKSMIKVAEDSTFRKELIEKGIANSKKYSWKDFAKTVQSAIEQIA